MTYGQPFGVADKAAAAAAMAGAAATPQQIAKAQRQAFTLATNASKLIGPQVAAGLAASKTISTQLQRDRDLLGQSAALVLDAHNQFAANMTVGIAALIRIVGSVWGRNTSRITGAAGLMEQAYRLLTEYYSDVNNALVQVNRVYYNLGRVPFKYRSTVIGKHDVKSCSNLRAFKGQADIAEDVLGSIYQSLYAVRKTLSFYGSDAGRQRRNQTKQLMTEAKLACNDLMAFLTSMARSNVALANIRRWVDIQNDNICESPYSSGDNAAATCHGLNSLAAIFKLVAAKQGRSWTNYRMRWRNLSNSDKERNIKTGLTLLREDVIKPMRDRKIPNAREQFVDLFAGMTDVVGKVRGQFTTSQYNALGPIAQATLQVTSTMSAVRQADVQADSLQFPLAVMGDLTPVQCQQGSGYAGIFSSDDEGEPMNPLFVIGGGLVAGVALAHFMPALRKR